MSRILLISIADFLHREITGPHTAQSSKKHLAELVEAWNLDRTRNILIDLREAEVRFSPSEVRAHVEAVLASGLGRDRDVAIVYTPGPRFDAVRFFEFLIRKFANRRLKVFEEYEDAMIWLGTAEKIESGVRWETR